MKVGNVDRLPGWHVAHLARRYAGLAIEPQTGVTDADRERFAEIAEALRSHPNHPRSMS